MTFMTLSGRSINLHSLLGNATELINLLEASLGLDTDSIQLLLESNITQKFVSTIIANYYHIYL